MRRQVAGALTDDTTPRPLPPEFNPREWRIVPTAPTQVLRDGDVLDLGGRKLHIVHTPGHTVDGISLFDDASGALFGGDTIMSGPIYTHLPTGDLGISPGRRGAWRRSCGER